MSLPRRLIYAVTRQFPLTAGNDATASTLRKLAQQGINPNKIKATINLAKEIQTTRRIHKEPNKSDSHYYFFADPLKIAGRLNDFGADEATIIAAILYPSLRSHNNEQAAQDFFVKIEKIYGAEVTELIKNALQIREINLHPPKTQEDSCLPADYYQPTTTSDQISAFRAMLEECITDPRAFHIRATQWLIRLEEFGLQGNQDEPDGELQLTKKIYLPIAARLNLYRLRLGLEDWYARTVDPVGYAQAAKLIEDVRTRYHLEVNGHYIDNAKGQEAIIFRNILREIQEATPSERRDQITIEYRLKSPASIWKKIRDKQASGQAIDLRDIIGIRVIVKSFANESELDAVISIGRAISRKFYHRLIDAHEKNYLNRPRENGYRALHYTVKSGDNLKFEVQIVGEEMHRNNQVGSAAHTGYKGYKIVEAIPKGERVSFFIDGQIFTLPKGSEILDAITLIDPRLAFSLAGISITSHNPFRYSRSNARIISEIHTGDELRFSFDPEFLKDANRRIRIIKFSQTAETREKLIASHLALLAKEQPDIVVLGSPARPIQGSAFSVTPQPAPQPAP